MFLSHALGWAAPLQIQMDGADTNRTSFCVGENVTLTCTVALFVHRWIIPGFTPDSNNGVTILANDPEVSIPPFQIEFVDVLESYPNIITSVSFIVSPDLEGLPITCSGTSDDPQSYTGSVLGETGGAYLSHVHHLNSQFASDI